MNLYQIDFESIKIMNIVITYRRQEHLCLSMIYYQNKIKINKRKQILNFSNYRFGFLKLKYVYLDHD